MVKDVVLNVRRINQLGDQQLGVLLSKFEFPSDEIVVMDECVIDSKDELVNLIEQSNSNKVEILIIPKFRGG